MIEVPPNFSEATHLRSSIYLTRKLTSAKVKLHSEKQSHGPSIQKRHFRKKIDIPTILGQGTPFFSKHSAELWHLYRITRRTLHSFSVELLSEKLLPRSQRET